MYSTITKHPLGEGNETCVLEAKLLVNDVWVFLVLLSRYPHLRGMVRNGQSGVQEQCRSTCLLEGIQTGENRSTNPCGILALWRSIDLDLDILQCEFLDFVEQTVSEAYAD